MQHRTKQIANGIIRIQSRRHYASSPNTGQQGPLFGITVVSLEQAIAAPFATRQLADLGARVIKVERPGVGDFARQYDTRTRGLASHFVWTNRSKESLALDLKKPGDLDVLKSLVGRADVCNIQSTVHTDLGLRDMLTFRLSSCRCSSRILLLGHLEEWACLTRI